MECAKNESQKYFFSGKRKKDRAATTMREVGFTSYASFADARTARYSTIMSKYDPKPLDMRVIYISVDFGPGKWKRVSENLEAVKSTGTHYVLDIPHIASVLSAHLCATKHDGHGTRTTALSKSDSRSFGRP